MRNGFLMLCLLFVMVSLASAQTGIGLTQPFFHQVQINSGDDDYESATITNNLYDCSVVGTLTWWEAEQDDDDGTDIEVAMGYLHQSGHGYTNCSVTINETDARASTNTSLSSEVQYGINLWHSTISVSRIGNQGGPLLAYFSAIWYDVEGNGKVGETALE